MPKIISAQMGNRTPGISILAKDRIPANNRSGVQRKRIKSPGSAAKSDRPGWIPPEITRNWDTDPYSYQTEEGLMPAGGLYGELLTNITEILKDYLKQKRLRFLVDTFILTGGTALSQGYFDHRYCEYSLLNKKISEVNKWQIYKEN